MKTLITGTAGFIGMACAKRLLDRGNEVVGIDNLNDYYDVDLKQARLSMLLEYPKFSFKKIDIRNCNAVAKLFAAECPGQVVHLAAQAGVRFSLENPHVYQETNIQGFLHILEGCKNTKVQHFVYASSSSVYGGNKSMPFS